MAPTGKSDNAEPDAARQKFRKRGDLGILTSGSQSDCDLIAQNHEFHVHKAILASRGGRLEKLLNANGAGPGPEDDNSGRTVVYIESHTAKAVDLVLEFIYGASKIEDVEYPAPGAPFIQNCILLFNLGHQFEITSLSEYATLHLGSYLSRKLSEICTFPLLEATKAAALNGFIADLEGGIIEADKTSLASKDQMFKLPLDMLTDFVLAGREVLLREAGFRLTIKQGILPREFAEEVLLAQFGGTYKTAWMKNLAIRPQRSQKLQPLKGWKCNSCGEKVPEDETVNFNPWSGVKVAQRYTQVCCEECARGMEKGHGKGVSWAVFDDTE